MHLFQVPNSPGIITSLIRFYLFWKFGNSPQSSPSYKPIPIWWGGVQKDQQMGIKSCSIQYTCVESHGLEHCRWGSCECRNEIFLFFCSRSKTIGVSFPKCLTITAVKGQWPLLIYPHVEDHSLHPQSLYWRYWVKIYLPFYPKNLGCWNFLAFCAFFFF